MTNKEKSILRKAIDSNEGLISPATIINSYAGGDQRSVELLVTQGYLERVYQFQESPRGGTYSIIFYAVTEKGLAEFAPFHKRLWFNFKTHSTLYVAVASIIFGIITSITSWYLVTNSIKANRLAEKELLPNFEVSKQFEGINRGVISATSSETIVFENKGGSCLSPSIKTISFIEVSITEGEETKLFLVPLEDYFTWFKVDSCKPIKASGSSFDNIIPGSSNYAKVIYMFSGLYDGSKIIFSHPVNFIKISYQDTFGNYKDEYYLFRTVPPIEKLKDQSEWENASKIYDSRKKFSIWSSGKEILQYIETLSPDYKYPQHPQ